MIGAPLCGISAPLHQHLPVMSAIFPVAAYFPAAAAAAGSETVA